MIENCSFSYLANEMSSLKSVTKFLVSESLLIGGHAEEKSAKKL